MCLSEMAGIASSHSLVKQGYAALTARPAVSSGVDRRPRMLMQRTGSDPFAGDSAGYGPSGGSEGQGRSSPGGSCSTGTVYVGTRDARIRVTDMLATESKYSESDVQTGGSYRLRSSFGGVARPRSVCEETAGLSSAESGAEDSAAVSPLVFRESHNAWLSAGSAAVGPTPGPGRWALGRLA